jgi:DNA-binding transcriptional ArsR family regulator
VTYDAVSAYTVLFGDGEAPATVSVHGSAEEAWGALDVLVRGRSRRWRARPGVVDEDRVTELAETWRRADPERRYWQVAPHRLRVTVPAIADRATLRPA